uniref:Uncharacterized protein n=1 Tax=Anguilla anguilla TaxID=7936 RepID=A0A0E9RPH1_ANGAN
MRLQLYCSPLLLYLRPSGDEKKRKEKCWRCQEL